MDKAIANEGCWAVGAARVIGLWLIAFVGSWVIWFSTEFFYNHSGLQLVSFLVISVLLAPAYGFGVYSDARRRNLRKTAVGAKAAMIVALALNLATIMMMLALADTLKHMR